MKDYVFVRVPVERPGLNQQLKGRAEQLILPGEAASVSKLCDGMYVVEVSRIYGTATPAHVTTAKGAIYWSGYIRRACYSAPWWESNLRFTGNGVVLRNSPGGIASFLAFDREAREAHFWCSLGALERVFHTSHEGTIAVSNSPLLSHCLAYDRLTPSSSEDWLRDVIAGLGSISTLTQFAGTFALPIDQSLVLDADGGLRTGDFPLEVAYSVFPQSDLGAVQELCDELLEALDPLQERGRPYVRLSGGKDSRMLAALLIYSGMDAHYVTHGAKGEPEPSVVEALAFVGKIQCEIRLNPLVGAGEILESAYRQQRRSDGMLIGIKHLLADDDAILHGFGSLVEGQAHHQRGGYARPVRPDPQRILQTFQNRLVSGAEFLEEAVAQDKRSQVTSLFVKLSDGMRFDISALRMYAEAKIPSVMNPYYRRQSRKIAKLHPFMDERVLLQTYRLNIWDLTSERAFFKVLCQLVPEFTLVPLYRDHWNFDRLSPLGHTAAILGIESPSPDPATRAAPTSPKVNPRHLARTMLRELRDAGQTIDLRGLVKSAYLAPDGFIRDTSDIDVKTMWKMISLNIIMRPDDWIRSH